MPWRLAADNTTIGLRRGLSQLRKLSNVLGDPTMSASNGNQPEQRCDEVGFQNEVIGKPKRKTNFYPNRLLVSNAIIQWQRFSTCHPRRVASLSGKNEKPSMDAWLEKQ